MNKGRSFLKEFKTYYTKVVFGENKQLRFEDRLIILTCMVIALVGLISGILNYYLDLSKGTVYSSAFLFVVFVSYFLVARFWGLRKLLYYLITFTVLIFLDFAWYYNCGSRGSVLMSFIVVFAFLIFVWDNKKIVYVTGTLGLNLFILFYLEYNHPNIVGTYVSEQARISDYYIGLSLSLILTLIFALKFKWNYLKEYNQARKADKLKSAFLANMSHEIRTPLNAIVGFSSLIADKQISIQKREEFNRHIQTNSDLLLELIEGIVDLSKFEVGEMKLNIVETNLAAIFERLKMQFSNTLQREKKELLIDYQLDMNDPVALTDGCRLEQVLRHLISNAVKFTSKGEIVFGCERHGKELTFYVKDTGIGIEQENQERIFDRFVKLENNSSELSRGTGIGLYLSKRIIEKLGGRIWVNSNYGVGTTFSFTIRANKVESPIFSDVQK